MKLLTVIAVLFAFQAAHADIARPRKGTSEDIRTSHFQGAAAEAVYESSDVRSQTTGALRTSITTVKVIRSKDDLYQVVCEATESRIDGKTSYSCETQASQDEKPLPVYRVRIRMG